MRFLFIAPRYHTNQHYVMKSLIDNGHEVKFIAFYKGFSEEYSALEPSILSFSKSSLALEKLFNKRRDEGFKAKYGFPKFSHLNGLMRGFNPDVVVIRSPKGVVSWLFILMCKIFKKSFIIYTQGPKFREKNADLVRIVRFLFLDLLGGVWITPVEGEKRNRRAVTHPSLYYLPFVYEVGPNNFLQRAYFENGKVRILSVGKYVSRKKHRLLLRAVAAIRDIAPIEVTLIGECSTEEHRREVKEIRKLIAYEGLLNIVTVRKNLSFTDVQAEYLKHDIFVLPSTDEPAAYSLLEAMAHGLPVVCSEANGTLCYIQNGVSGYAFKDDSVSDLKEKLRLLIEDKTKIVDFGKVGYKIVKERHSLERYHSDLISILKARFNIPSSLSALES